MGQGFLSQVFLIQFIFCASHCLQRRSTMDPTGLKYAAKYSECSEKKLFVLEFPSNQVNQNGWNRIALQRERLQLICYCHSPKHRLVAVEVLFFLLFFERLREQGRGKRSSAEKIGSDMGCRRNTVRSPWLLTKTRSPSADRDMLHHHNSK